MNPWHLRLAAIAVCRDGVIAYPTEAVYGLGCRPDSRSAVHRILRLKRRPGGMGLILLAAEAEQLDALVSYAGIDRDRVWSTWPGPVTWLLPPGRLAPPWVLGSGGRVAVRVTAFAPARALCERTGPLVSTSANPHGRPPARTAARVRAYFPGRLDYVAPGRCGGRVLPSEIRDGRSGAVLRKGG